MATKKTEVKEKVESKVINQSIINIHNAAILQEKSAGAKIRDIFAKVLADGKITVEVMNQLTSEKFTKSMLNIRYAFLKHATKNPNDRKINGRARYGAKVIEINGEKFWVTNDLYEKQIEIFEIWACSLYGKIKK